MAVKSRNPRGRPVEHEMPDRIPDTPDNLARIIVTTPPKKEGDWEYLKKSKRVLPASAKRQSKKKGQ